MTNFYTLLKWGRSSNMVFGIVGFFIGRSVFFSAFNPFVMAYTAAFFCKREFYFVSALSALGLLTVTNEINVFRYIFAILLIVLFYITTDKERINDYKIAAYTFLSTLSGGLIYTLFGNYSMYQFIMSFLEAGLSSVLFYIIKDNVGILNVFDHNVIQAESYSGQVSRIIALKLKKASDVFMRIAGNYDKSMLIEMVDEEKAKNNIAENIRKNVCSNCKLKVYCWDKNSEKTENTFYNMIDKWMKIGYVKTQRDFTGECENSSQVYMLAKGCIEVYKLNKLWLKKIEQSKLLVGRQLEIVSHILSELKEEVLTGFNIDKELSNKVYKELTGLSVNSVVVCKGKRGYEISVSIPHYYSCNECGREIITHINEILGVNMIRDSSSCRVENNNCVLHLVEAPKLRIAAYSAAIKKENSEITGDCYTYMEIDEGRYLLALADGMGSGKGAREESAASIEMYEDFMEAGFDKDSALDIINSVLLAGGENECFSTLDICTINMYSGETEFVKIGAVSTFILRDNGIELIKADTLPVGILEQVDTYVTKTTVNEGDRIIMVTDGILESTGYVVKNEKWLLNVIDENRDKNPKAMAEIILNRAKENSGSVIRDDMTVLVAEVY